MLNRLLSSLGHINRSKQPEWNLYEPYVNAFWNIIFLFLFADIPVTPVSERCDDKATTVAKILVAIVDTGSYHPHYCLLLLKVISQL